MNAEPQNVRQVAILSADVKDDNHLMRENEKSTIRTRGYYLDIMTLHIQKHKGQVINAAGENLLAKFSSVVKALGCAREIQHEIRAMNARAPKNRKMNFGIGINYGDVFEGQGRNFGEGVSIAIRLAGLAPEGGICISGTAYDQVKNKLPFTYDYQGNHTPEPIKKPVRVYRVALGQKAVGKLSGDKTETPKHKKKVAQRINAVLIAVFIVGALWFYYWHDSTPPSQEILFNDRLGSNLSDKPSLAVLPFVHLFKDPQQEDLSNGITSNITSRLAEYKGLSIVSHNRMMAYKGRPVRIKDLRKELGVKYVVEGSVRQAGNKVRIYAHLMDIKGHRIWAKEYDCDVTDLAAAQDEIVQKIATLMTVKREAAE